MLESIPKPRWLLLVALVVGLEFHLVVGRFLALTFGRPGLAAVQSVYRGDKGRGWTVSLDCDHGDRATARAARRRAERLSRGEQVSIHYCPVFSTWVFLDDDGGAAAANAGFSIPLLALGLWLMGRMRGGDVSPGPKALL